MKTTDILLIHLNIALFFTSLTSILSFVPAPANNRLWGIQRRNPKRHAVSSSTSDSLTTATTTATSASNDADIDTATTDKQQQQQQPSAVRAPLKYVGPYPCLGLHFPNLSTQSQRERNVTGISLDFVLDTAANTNTINAAVASELDLDVVGSALPGVGAGGAISGGQTYMLGNCELEGLPSLPVMEDEEGEGEGQGEEKFTFMSGLTASALPVASPSAAGLLGLYFFNAFPGGVEFAWGDAAGIPQQQQQQQQQQQEDRPTNSPSAGVVPSVTFYSSRDDMGGALDGLRPVSIKKLPVSDLPSVPIEINGVSIPALLDTGSPITVLNAKAARLAGVETMRAESDSGGNPFAKLAQGFKTAQAAARGDVLLIAGASGERVELVRSKEPCGVSVGDVEMGESRAYVGDLPGLAALGGLGGSSAPPAAVLGMDILRLRPRMVYRPDEVYL